MRRRRAAEHGAACLVVFVLMTVGAPTASSQSQNDGWSVFMGLRESQQFGRVTNDIAFEDRISDSASAGLSYSTRTERSSLSLNTRVGVNHRRKPETTNADRVNYGAGMSWSYRASSRSQMRLSQRFSKNIRLETLSDLGVFTNDFDTITATTGWSYQHQSGPRTSWSTNLGYGYREFRNAQPVDGSQIVLDEEPFGNDLAIPTGVFEEPQEFELPDGEEDVLRILATEGLAADTTARSHRGSAGFGFTHGFSSRTSMNIGVSGGYRTITSDESREGSYGAVNAVLQRTVSTSSAINMGYTHSRTLVVDPSISVQTLFAGWSYSPRTSTLSINLSGGASRYEQPGSSATTAPVASASLSGAPTSSTTAGISYRRQFSVSRGYGRSLLIDYLGMSLAQQLGTRVSARLFAGLSFGSQPLDEDQQQNTRRAGGSISANLIGGLRLGTSYFYTEFEQRSALFLSEGERQTWSVYLNYSTGW